MKLILLLAVACLALHNGKGKSTVYYCQIYFVSLVAETHFAAVDFIWTSLRQVVEGTSKNHFTSQQLMCNPGHPHSSRGRLGSVGGSLTDK